MRVLFLFSLCFFSGVSHAVSVSYGVGSAVDENQPHQSANFEWELGVDPNIPVYNYQEDGLIISRIDGSTHGTSSGHMDAASNSSHKGFQGFTGGFFYKGSALEAVSISVADGTDMLALEVMIGTGYPDSETAGSWETYRDGVLTGSGYFTYVDVGTTIGFYDANGFDELLIGTGRGDQSGSFFATNRLGATAIDNVRVATAVPIPAAVWLFGSGLGLLGWFRRRKIA